MTVRDLMEILEDYDEDTEVCIGMEQNYGSNFAYIISEVEQYDINNWDHDDSEMVVFTMGRQFGTVHYE